MIFGTTVIDYDWPTSALIRTVTAASVPAGLTVYYGDVVRCFSCNLHCAHHRKKEACVRHQQSTHGANTYPPNKTRCL